MRASISSRLEPGEGVGLPLKSVEAAPRRPATGAELSELFRLGQGPEGEFPGRRRSVRFAVPCFRRLFDETALGRPDKRQ